VVVNVSLGFDESATETKAVYVADLSMVYLFNLKYRWFCEADFSDDIVAPL
jgi:hypothetical protein